MKITDVKTVLLTGPLSNDPYITEMKTQRSAAFIEIHTDSDLLGMGETYAGYFCPEIVPEIVNFFKPILIGQDPQNIDQLFRRMYHCGNFWCRLGLGLIVLNGIEAALWDLKGKACGLPVYELLGGRKHDRLLGYATGGPSNYPIDKLFQKIEYYHSLGFNAYKIGAGSWADDYFYIPTSPAEAADFEADKISQLRRHFGKDLIIMMDGHMGNSFAHTWDLPTAAAVLRALEPYDLFFFEEPLHYNDLPGYAELTQNTSVPVAGGECLTGLTEWQRFVERDAFNIAQPDASYTGSLSQIVQLAAILDARNRKIATHAWGAAGSLMQNIHCGFACANTAILEIPPAYAELHQEIIDDDFHMADGYVLPPQKPGLGIQLSEETKNKFPFISGTGEYNPVPGKPLPKTV